MRVPLRLCLVGVAAGVLLAGCSRLGGHAERVNVPLLVQLSPIPPPAQAKHPSPVLTSIVITDLGHQAVWALECRATAYDKGGRMLFQRDFNPSFPAGAYVSPGHPFRLGQFSGAAVNLVGPYMSPRTQARIDHYTATCGAFIWHGQIPV